MKLGIIGFVLVSVLGVSAAHAESQLQIYKCSLGKVSPDGSATIDPFTYGQGNLVASDIHGINGTTFLGLATGNKPSGGVYGYQLSTGEKHLLLTIYEAADDAAIRIFEVGQSPIQTSAKFGNDTYVLRCELR